VSGAINADEGRDPASALVAAWPELPEAIRAGIEAMVKAVSGKSGNPESYPDRPHTASNESTTDSQTD
jgi:hypothetical protein